MSLKKYIRDIQGFPKEGILFKDITPLLIDPKGRTECLKILVDSLKGKQIDKVIGVERVFLRNADCARIECWFYTS